MKTFIKTFKAKELRGRIIVPTHQRWKESSHIKNLNTSIKNSGFLTAITLYEKGDGKYSVEDGYQRLSSVIDKLPEQEIHAVIVPENCGVKQEDVFLSLNNIRKPLQLQDYVRFHATKIGEFTNNNFYTFVWNKIYGSPENHKEMRESLGNGELFSHSAIKDFFTSASTDSFRRGYAKLKDNHRLRLELFHLIQSNYIHEVNKRSEIKWGEMNHRLVKCAMVIVLNRIITKEKNISVVFDTLVDFAIYLNKEMPSYLRSSKDNAMKYYLKFVNEKTVHI